MGLIVLTPVLALGLNAAATFGGYAVPETIPPEPVRYDVPSCSHDEGTCDPIQDWLAYACGDTESVPGTEIPCNPYEDPFGGSSSRPHPSRD